MYTVHLSPWSYNFLTIHNWVINIIVFFLLGTITCFQMVWEDHRKFAITVQKCKFTIFKLVILQFYCSRWCFYIFLIIYFLSTRNSERYRVIVWNSGMPIQNVSALNCNYYYYGFIHLVIFALITYYLISVIGSFLSQKLETS